MDEKNKRMQLERANHKKLSDEVQNLVVSVVLVLLCLLLIQTKTDLPCVLYVLKPCVLYVLQKYH